MALLTCVAISAASFLIGTLFTSELWDSTILFSTKGPITPEVIAFVENYYLTWWDGAMAVKMVLHVIAAILFVSVSAKFARYTDTTFFFSGGSLLLLILTASLYITITLPYIRTLAKDPIVARTTPYIADDLFSKIQYYVTKQNTGPLGDAARANAAADALSESMSFTDRVEFVSVLSAANTIAIVLLVGVVILQIGEWWTEDTIVKEAEEAAVVAPVTAEKKKQ